MVVPTCAVCGCRTASAAHRLVAALAVDDVDAALELGLLDAEPCADCLPACREQLLHARDQRRAALAARERYRQRNARLQRRAEQRAARRASPVLASTSDAPAAPSTLPSAAAAALARARAKAAQRHKP